MPNVQALTQSANTALGAGNIGNLHQQNAHTLIPTGTRLVAGMAALGITLPPGAAAFVATIPPSMQEAIRAVVANAIERNLPVTFAWQPGYDFGVNIAADAQDTEATRGGITVLITTRYPNDSHPLAV